MKTFLGMLSGAVLALSALGASASSLDPSTYGFTLPGAELLNDGGGVIDYSGPGDLIIIEADGTDLYAEVFPSDPADAFLDWLFLPEPYDASNATVYSSVMMSEIDVFFDLGSIGYLLEANIFNLNADLTNENLEFIEDATVIVTEFRKPAPIPLPAGLPLILAGLGSFAAIRLRKRG